PTSRLRRKSRPSAWPGRTQQRNGESRDDKGSQGINEGFKSQAWERFFEFTGTKLQEFPVPKRAPLKRARRLDRLAMEVASTRALAVCADQVPSRESLNVAHGAYDRWQAEMIAVQEELDWEVYRLYDLLDKDITAPAASVPGLKLGERA